MLHIKLFITALALVIFAGCTSVGSKALEAEDSASINSKIIEGQTQKVEVVSMLGAPSITSFTDSGLEIMTYEHTRFKPKWYNFIPYNFVHLKDEGKKKELVILLDEQSVVKRIVMNEADIERGFGVAH